MIRAVQESRSEQEWIITQPTAQPFPQAYIKEGHGELIISQSFQGNKNGSERKSTENLWCACVCVWMGRGHGQLVL